MQISKKKTTTLVIAIFFDAFDVSFNDANTVY